MAKTTPVPAAPLPNDPKYAPPAGQLRDLYERVKETLTALPIYFRTETVIAGLIATDLHTLNTVLGATIEEQVVRTLNLLRRSWDPKDEYPLFSFVRQPQTFPDVRLKKTAGTDTLLGFDLKGWYLLAKEAEPSLRFTASTDACAAQDLIVVVPWALNNVISGSPIVFEPYIVPAKFAADFRNHHWEYRRQTKGNPKIKLAAGVSPYPATKRDKINDNPEEDTGGNFGRLARTGIMDAYMEKLKELTLCGIKTDHWRNFLKAFQEGASDAQVDAELTKLRNTITTTVPSPKADAVLRILADLEVLLQGQV